MALLQSADRRLQHKDFGQVLIAMPRICVTFMNVVWPAGEGNSASSLSFQTNFSGALTVRQGQVLNGQPQLEMDFPNELPDSDCPSWAFPDSPFMKARDSMHSCFDLCIVQQ